jgi:hypothetical protein
MFAPPLSRFHQLAAGAGLARLSACVANSPQGLQSTLHDIWLGRLTREALDVALKTPLRRAALDLVDCTLPRHTETGCVFAICRTPWVRLLSEWCCDRNFGLILSGRSRVRGGGHVDLPQGVPALHRLVRHLRRGGRAFVLADRFDGSRTCPVRFLGADRSVSLLPAHLAAHAGVPLQAALPVFAAGRVQLRPGPLFTPAMLIRDPAGVTRDLLAFFEREFLQRPAFLMRFSTLPSPLARTRGPVFPRISRNSRTPRPRSSLSSPQLS